MAIGLDQGNKKVKETPSKNENSSAKSNRFIHERDNLQDSLDDVDARDRPHFDRKKILLVSGAVVVAGLLFIFLPRVFNQVQKPVSSVNNVATSAPMDGNNAASMEPVASEDSNEDKVNLGATDYRNSTKNTTTARYFDADDFVKDIDGNDISAVYSYRDRTYINDYANYVAKRGIIDDGMEVYWLDITYKKKKYRMQIPFYYFKDLDDSGICKVEIEVLTLDNGSQVISYMHIIDEDS